MIYGRPVIRVVASLNVFFERLLPRTVPLPADTDWRAKKLKEFIDLHQGKIRWRLGDTCKKLGFPMSDRQARRLFRISMGVGIKEYSMNRRLASAAEQLRATNAPIKAIAVEVGYQTTGHFARSFKELFCLTPMEFRRIWRLNEIAA
jgi:transcriptional regulator GlxA family with amidase domain